MFANKLFFNSLYVIQNKNKKDLKYFIYNKGNTIEF